MTRDDLDLLIKSLEILAFFGGGAATIITVTRAVTKFEFIGQQQAREITDMKHTLTKVGDLVTQMATEKVRLDNQGQRITRLEDTIELLRRGEGMILPLDMSLANKIRAIGGGGEGT